MKVKSDIIGVFDVNGRQCVIKEIFFSDNKSHLCGYVEVKEGEIAYEIYNYDDIPIFCHGGLTYFGKVLDNKRIFVGFDCGHAGDNRETQNEAYVTEQIKKVAKQLDELTWEQVMDAKIEYMPEWFKKRIKYRRCKENENTL